MPTLPADYHTLIGAFAPIFSHRIWQHAVILLTGAILAVGKRTVTSVLRVMGLSHDTHFQNYHRMLNRAVWSSLEASRILLGLGMALDMPLVQVADLAPQALTAEKLDEIEAALTKRPS